MDPVMEYLLKGGIGAAGIAAMAWLSVKALAGFIAAKFKATEDALNAAHAESRKECREDNIQLAKRLESVEDEGRKNSNEKQLILIRALDSSVRMQESTNRVVEKVLERFPDITPPKGNRNL